MALRATTTCAVTVGVLLLFLSSTYAFAHEGIHEQIDALRDRIEHNPGNVEALYLRAELLRRHNRYTEALEDLDALRALAPKHRLQRLSRGLTYLGARRYEEAEAVLRAYLREAPDSSAGHLALARTLVAREKRQLAIASYQAAIRFESSPRPEQYLELARLQVRVPTSGTTAALKTLDAGIETLGAVVSLLLEALSLETKAGSLKAALARLSMLESATNLRERWLPQRAEILCLSGHTDDARACIEEFRVWVQSLPPARRNTKIVQEQVQLADQIQAGLKSRSE